MATCIYTLEVETDATIRALCEEELATAYHDLQLCLSIVYRFAHGKILGKYVPLLPLTGDPDVKCFKKVRR